MELVELLTDPAGVQTWRLGESALVELTAALSQRIGELEALRVRLVAQLEEHGTAKTLGAASTASWLSGATRMSPGTAGQIVNLGKALVGRPATAAALQAGQFSTAHAKVIVGFFDRLPDGVPADALPECEAYLVEAAATDTPVELARRAAALRHLLEPVEDSLPDAENAALNELFASTTLGGRGAVKADLDAETMEMLQTALSALATPHPGQDGSPDKRSAAQRRADAFTELLRRYLDSAKGPTEGYERPHLSLLIHADDLATPAPPTTGSDDAAAAAADGADGAPATAGAAGAAADRAEPLRATADRDAYTDLFGVHPAAPGWMPWIGPISAASARRIACDCELTAILLDANGVPLNLGRSQRLVSPAQRKALIARDHGCAFPGCGRPPAWADAHHIRHWIDGGTTDLNNLVLLCRHHHRTIHHDGWDVILGSDNHPWFRPPAWIDPQRQPRPAHHRPQHHHHTAA